MKISVIMPAYNREAFIETAIRSLLRQRDDADLDIIVVDDGSTDRTAVIVSQMAEGEAAIRLIRQPNRGVAHARNTGLDNIHEDAELVTFLDSDDVCLAGRFGLELPLFRQDPNLAMAYSLMKLTEDIDDLAFSPQPGATTCTLRGISLASAIFRRQTLDQIGRFNENLKQSEDLDFLLRFFELPLKYQLTDTVSVLYRRHAGGMTKNREEAERSFMRALVLSAGRRRMNRDLQEIPRFFDLTKLREKQYAVLR